MTDTHIEPGPIDVSGMAMEDLRHRLGYCRWPEPVEDWSQSAPLGRVQALAAYWHDHYDWRRCNWRCSIAGGRTALRLTG